MQLLNVGCGTRFSSDPRWTNIDIVSTGAGVIAHNLRTGIPFPAESFDLVYHSHVFEHIPKAQSEYFMSECIRVLKPNGILRIAIPDLEQIVRNYLRLLEDGLNDPLSKNISADYDWMMLEMYDQTVRNQSGGEMRQFLSDQSLSNEEFVVKRCGYEVRNLINLLQNRAADPAALVIPASPEKHSGLMKKIHSFLKHRVMEQFFLKNVFKKEYDSLQLGRFREGGEIHQWMYDRYSIARLLSKLGMSDIRQQQAEKSFLNGWAEFNLDTERDASVYKPDSLYMEGIKK